MSKRSTYRQRYSDAWKKLRLEDRERPDEVFPRWTKESFDDLKKKYNEKYGYRIRIPNIEEIVHLVPRSLKSPEEIKAEKREALMRVLASPAPDFARKYSSVMTWLDNIQDTTSVIYPAVSMLARWSPKIFGRAIPLLGWMMLGGDILNWVIGVGRLPMTPMGGKRLFCHHAKNGLFNKKARFARNERLKNFNPGISDLLQTLQVTDQFIGVGLNLGPMMGAIMDAGFGLYKYLTGEPVKISYDVPDMFEYEMKAGRAMETSGLINSAGQVFSEETHFWSLVMGAVGSRLFSPVAYESDIAGSVLSPENIMIPAHIPTDPTTIEVIEAEGLSVQEGIGWPYNGKNEIRMGDLSAELIPRCREVFRDYCFRHSKDWYGFVVATMWDQVLPSTIFAFDPGNSVEYEDTPEMKTAFRMLKAPLIPAEQPTESQAMEFMNWIAAYENRYHGAPGIMAIKEKFDSLGIKYKESYPEKRETAADPLWDKDFSTVEFNLA